MRACLRSKRPTDHKKQAYRGEKEAGCYLACLSDAPLLQLKFSLPIATGLQVQYTQRG